MPTYEYECKSCGHTFEVFQSMSEDPLKSCPECGKAVRRLIFGGTGVIFKGSGFYVTDKGKSSAGGPAKNSKPAETASSGGAASGYAASGGAGSGPEKSLASKSGPAESAAKKSETAGTAEKAKTA